MFLRELDGLYAGQIREFPAEIGAALLAAGRAVNPFAESIGPATVPAVSGAAVADAVIAQPRKAGRK